jgi:hypothetical protein
VLQNGEDGGRGLRMLPLVREAGLKPPGHDADKICLLGEMTHQESPIHILYRNHGVYACID